jgi:4-alpha-glucanotransferase
VPLQDLLNLGGDARMNLPGRATGNWSWRFLPEQLTGHLAERLLDATHRLRARPQTYEGKDPESGGQSGQDVKGAGG